MPSRATIEAFAQIVESNDHVGAIEKFYADNFKGWQPKNHTSTIDPHSVRMLGPDNLTRGGVWSETGKGKNGEDVPIKGYWSVIVTRQGDGWKICRATGNVTPAP